MPCTYKAVLGNKTNSDGTKTVMIRITKDRKPAYYAPGVRITPAHWNPKATYEKSTWIRNTHPMHAVYNNTIKIKIQTAERHVMTLDQSGAQYTSITIKELLQGKTGSISFTNFWKEQIPIIAKKYSWRTGEKYQSELEKLTKFSKTEDILFSQINYDFVEKYEIFLLEINNRNTASKSLEFLRAMIKRAVKHKLLQYDKNPFLAFEIKEAQVDKVRLSENEIKLFEKAKLKKGLNIYHSRNIFLMQYYCAGRRINDVLQMRWEDINSGRWTYYTGKVRKLKSILLTDKAIKILKLYGYGKKKKGFVFPFLSDHVDYSDKEFLDKQIEAKTALINPFLKKIAKMLEINKNISTHTARHSFADLSRRVSKDLHAIKNALDHSSVKITENYLNSLDDGAVDDLLGQVFK